MKLAPYRLGVCIVLLVGVGSLCAGCGKAEPHRAARGKKVHTHGEWWCDEHGIPEDECSMCNTKLKQELKMKGDWCEAHRRVRSQCFFCDPSLKEKYAEKYRAKYDKEPPPIGEMEKKSDPG